jgi:hypothetical protein
MAHVPSDPTSAADGVGIGVAQALERRINLGFAPKGGGPAGAERHAHAVVGEHFELDDVVDRLAAHHGVRSAGVVADHAAERVVRVRGRIGREGEAVAARGVPQVVEHAAGLDARGLRCRVDLEHAVHVLREIEQHGDVARLPAKARAAAAREHGRVVAAADLERAHDVFLAAREHDADGDLAVVRRIGRVQRAAAGIEAHFAVDRPRQLARKALARRGRRGDELRAR